ncbi:MAG: hypothetical protein K6G26_04620 [Lachnospiraceae bacterium]|nr:hypothetical protein [Lachnospiraceae bacterium]
MSFKDKLKTVVDTYSNGDEEVIIDNSEDDLIGAKGFEYKDGFGAKLDINGCWVKQYKDSCWASSIATCARYRNFKKYKYLNGEDVSNKVGVEYGKSSSITKMLEACEEYDLDYKYLGDDKIMSFDKITKNILKEAPVMMISYNNTGGAHATTCVGYTNHGGIKQIIFFNSGSYSITTVEYKSSGTKYSYSNQILTWKRSLYIK